jgi:hypothetical protein
MQKPYARNPCAACVAGDAANASWEQRCTGVTCWVIASCQGPCTWRILSSAKSMLCVQRINALTSLHIAVLAIMD